MPPNGDQAVKYRVSMETGAWMSITVEADDPDEAIERAYEEIPGDICAHCSGWGQTWSRELSDDWQVSKNDDGTPIVRVAE